MNNKLSELDKKAKLFKAYTKHDGVINKLDDFERKIDILQESMGLQQD